MTSLETGSLLSFQSHDVRSAISLIEVALHHSVSSFLDMLLCATHQHDTVDPISKELGDPVLGKVSSFIQHVDLHAFDEGVILEPILIELCTQSTVSIFTQ